MMRDRKLILSLAAGAAMLALAARHPTANLRLVTHEARDPAPRRFQAVVDLGLVGVSLLYTWSARPIG